jgi:hypothetical protein
VKDDERNLLSGCIIHHIDVLDKAAVKLALQAGPRENEARDLVIAEQRAEPG